MPASRNKAAAARGQRARAHDGLAKKREFDTKAEADKKDQRGDKDLQWPLPTALEREHGEGAPRRT